MDLRAVAFHGAPAVRVRVVQPRALPDRAQKRGSDRARRAGADRERALKECSSEAMRRLGLRSLHGFTANERLAWTRWSPLVVTIHDLQRWRAAEKRALIHVIRAKGGRRER